MIVWILQFLIGFIGIGLVVLVHESGHFLAARALGVRVETFGIGMGPKIFSYQGKNTEYCISLIPFGGYCRMDGSIDLVKALRDEQKSFAKGEYGSYFTTTPLVRLLIFLAGPLANFLLSVILFLIVAMIPVLEAVHEPRVVVAGDYSQVFGTTLGQAEVESGDLILSVDGRAVDSYEDVEDILASADRPSIPVRVLREGQILDLTLYGQQLDGHWRYGIALWQDAIVGRSEGSSPFQEGDRILTVNGSDVGNVYDIYLHTDEEMDFSLLRGDEVLTVSLPSTTSFPFAWAAELRPMERPSLVEAVVQGFRHRGGAQRDHGTYKGRTDDRNDHDAGLRERRGKWSQGLPLPPVRRLGLPPRRKPPAHPDLRRRTDLPQHLPDGQRQGTRATGLRGLPDPWNRMHNRHHRGPLQPRRNPLLLPLAALIVVREHLEARRRRLEADEELSRLAVALFCHDDLRALERHVSVAVLLESVA